MFFFDEYKDKLEAASKLPEIKRIAEMEEYYFQKAKDKFDEFDEIDISSIDVNALIAVTKQKPFSFEKWLNSYNADSAEYKLLLTIGQVISYFDTNAAMKSQLNEYSDKRVISKSNVRQNNWVEWLLKYKQDVDINTFPESIRNTIHYICNPERNVSISSENWRKEIQSVLFEHAEGNLFEEMYKTGITATNPLNNGVLYGWILWSDSVKALWYIHDEESQPAKQKANKQNRSVPKSELLKEYKEYLSNIYTESGAANSFKQAISYTLNYFGYESSKTIDVLDLKEKAEVLLKELKINSQNTISKIKPFFEQAESYLKDGFVRTSLPHFIDFLSKIGLTEQEPCNELCQKYTKADFLSEVYFDSEQYDDIVALIDRKKNIILQGAPGVGKSYMAKRLAYSIIGAKDRNKVEMIQFHQNYSYEDFIEGFRPNKDGKFVMTKGIFYGFCEKAKNDESNYIKCVNSDDEEKRMEANKYKYFFIVDEINRGNLSKVMGELMLLLENDKRGDEFSMKLTYSGERFYVPENVYVIGMMNTADRSLAMIDYALRRRFSFIPIEPVFENPQFVEAFKDNYPEAENVIAKILELNAYISKNLDSGHQIGHSYFCSDKPLSQKDIDGIMKYEVIELLNEYFFDDEEALNKARSFLQ